MKSFQALSLLLLSLLSVAKADNTPNLCTDQIPNLTKVKPSETASHSIPDIRVGSTTYSGDADHFIVRPPLDDGAVYKRIMVYIPGTTDRPELSSCLIKSAADTLQIPILALSYQYLSSGDSFRNGKCALLSLEEQIECLDEQHKDAIMGGDYGATHFKDDGSAFWGEILPENSLESRLTDLLVHLDTLYPSEGWSTFTTKGHPLWRKIVVSGHSQGAGHAAYLARNKKIGGAVMISGPQDECTGCPEGTKFWIDYPYKTFSPKSSYTALGHGNEPMIAIMQDNWKRMKAANPAINWMTSGMDGKNVGFAVDTTAKDACNCPLVTDVQYAATSTCGGKDHCSTGIDDSVPFIEKWNGDKLYLYEVSVWPSIFRAAASKKICMSV